MNKKGFGEWFMIIIVALFLLFGLIYAIVYATTSGMENVTIKDKWVKHKGSDAKYLVSTEGGQVFEITDSWWYGRWDSSNLYSDITVGEKCLLETQGFRSGFFSDYKNIISMDCSEQSVNDTFVVSI